MSTLRIFLAGLSLVFATSHALAQTGPQFVRDHIYGPSGKVALTAEPDTYAPTAPSGLGDTFDSVACAVDLTWGGSSDIGSGVSGYKVYKNGALIGTTSSTSYAAPVSIHGGTWTFTVKAYDVAGNVGPASNSFTITTPSCIQQAPVGANSLDAGASEELASVLTDAFGLLSKRRDLLDRLHWLERSGQLTVFQVLRTGFGGGL